MLSNQYSVQAEGKEPVLASFVSRLRFALLGFLAHLLLRRAQEPIWLVVWSESGQIFKENKFLERIDIVRWSQLNLGPVPGRCARGEIGRRTSLRGLWKAASVNCASGT